MKGKLIAFASILCIAGLMASGANADKPDDPGDKGDKGDKGKTKTELIVFTGALEGWAHVAGCCPNAGPNPLYTLTFTKDLVNSAEDTIMYPANTYEDGYLFMNGWSFEGESGYLVQFWHPDGGILAPLTFEIICGTSVYDRKTRVLRVTCDGEPWWNDYNRDIDMGPMTFDILRVPTRYCTGDICTAPQL
jgi:hypothetical protein